MLYMGEGRGKGFTSISYNMYSIYNTKLLSYNIKIPKKISNKTRQLEFDDPKALNTVITNLISCKRKNQKLVYSRNTGEKLINKNLTSRRVIKAVDFLVKKGFVENHIGQPSVDETQRSISYLLPTESFNEQYTDSLLVKESERNWVDKAVVFEIRDKNKNPCKYIENTFIRTLCDEVKLINEVNETAIVKDHEGNILTNIYCRVFNEDLYHGGRFYHADILQLKNNGTNNRLKVTINDNPVVECDYSTMHLRILAMLESVHMENPYDDMYVKVFNCEEINYVNRKIIKRSVNIMLNARNYLSAKGAITNLLDNLNYTERCMYSMGDAKDLMLKIKNAYPEFNKFFCVKDSFGLKLQNHDSMIASKVLMNFSSKRIPCLCVHDSFIVEQQHQDLLINTMADAFRDYLNVDVMVPIGVETLDSKIQCLA